MALTNQGASIGGQSTTIIVGKDGAGNLAAGHVAVNSAGLEVGTSTSPFVVSLSQLPVGTNAIGSVTVSNLPALQQINAASLPLPSGAASSANQPGLNNDGGALSHITNFPATQAVSWSGQTVGLSSLPSLPSGGNTIGSVNINASSNLATAQANISAAATQIAPARTGRRSMVVEQLGTTPIYLGGPTVTAGTGVLLPGVLGASWSFENFSGALYGITASGSQTIAVVEIY